MLENQVNKKHIWEKGLSGAAARTGILRNNTLKEYKKQNNKVWKRKFQKKTNGTKSKDNF